MEHALTFIDPTSIMFEPMYDMVHVDEKCFYEDVNMRSYLLFVGETALQRSRRSKNHVPMCSATDIIVLYR
ncbi:hypothetical protein JG687_00013491 [Phytophthora cactorum]|uniref:Uncharacterized protein n=1 Tax=Phytophthora cactorum TaxID=29920 RepID=A0A8T1U161_9STRA|nr:hypothetical protein JG687_00013491 [Phytophthora cactorum]